MKQIKFAQITALLFAANVMALSVSNGESFIAQAAGEVRGTVVDSNEARVSGATVTIEGEGLSIAVKTAEDGTYRIELAAGIYRIRVNSNGFCPARRAPFRMKPSTEVMLNFVLTTCPIVNDITIVDGQYVGETDRYKDPLKEDVFPLAHPSGPPLELLVRYRERVKDGHFIEYRRAAVSYDALMVRADRVRLDPRIFRLEAEGNVKIEDGKRCLQVGRAVVDLRASEPKLELHQ